jgi:hypothetical protein
MESFFIILPNSLPLDTLLIDDASKPKNKVRKERIADEDAVMVDAAVCVVVTAVEAAAVGFRGLTPLLVPRSAAG